jgi:hypothetical protein
VSVGPDPNQSQSTIDLIEKTTQEINFLVEEVSRMADRDMPPAEFFGEFLKRILTVLVAPAGAIWIRTPQGHLQLQYQINMAQVGLDKSESGRQMHDELLRQGLIEAKPGHFPPHSSAGTAQGNAPVAGNPTDFSILIAPILNEKQQVAGIVEVWQSPNRHPKAIRGFIQFLLRMAQLASRYLRNHQLRQMIGQQQVWTQLEGFTRSIHSSLSPTEVAYLVANEGRRLVECDRISVAVRYGRKCVIEAISGADVVEKRSNLVQLERKLCGKVIHWGEKLVYSGTKDDSLPPDVLEALDDYLAESHSKLLVVLPLRDERETENENKHNIKNPPRSALVMEAFEPNTAPEQLVAQLEVVGRHAASALYNAVEHRRIPMRFIWQPIATVQEGLGGKTRAILYTIGAALVVLMIAMVVVPYPLKMDARGQLLPEERRYITSQWPAEVVDFGEGVNPGSLVFKDQHLVLMHDIDLQERMTKLQGEIAATGAAIDALRRQLNGSSDAGGQGLAGQLMEKETLLRERKHELDLLKERVHADRQREGYFWLVAPFTGTVLNSDFRENMRNRFVKPSEPILRLGNKDGRWEIELKIPQKHIGQVLSAISKSPKKELDVDLLVTSVPTKVFRGKLAADKVGAMAQPNRDDNNESEPIVNAWVRVDGDDIPQDDRIPRNLLVTGVEVHSKIRCGNRAMGYSLFYGVWEFFYEKVVFFF